MVPTVPRTHLPGARERAAVAVVFVVHGMLFASWTAHVPTVKAHLRLTDSALGLALLGAPVGSVAMSALAGWLVPRFGSKVVVRVGLVGYCAAGPFVGLAADLPELVAALLGWGAFQGMLDVAMNAQGIAVERASGRRIMSGFHGGWGVGAFLGAGAGSAGVAFGLSLSRQLVILGVVALAVTWLPTTVMLPDHDGGQATVPVRQRFSRTVLILGAIAFATMLCEGASADWAAVYLRDHLGTSGGAAGLAYTGFALALVSVRLAGLKVPTHRFVPSLAALATVGFAAALAVDDAPAAYAGYVCLGVGVGTVVPAAFSAAGRLPGLHPGTGVATVAAVGWAGFLLGPPMIGGLASATSLRAALVLLPVLTGAIAVAAAGTPQLRS